MSVQKRTVSLSEEHATFIEAKLARGDYASISEVVRAGLRALKERDEVIEGWLLTEIVPVYDAMKADPLRGVAVDSVFASLKARHAARGED